MSSSIPIFLTPKNQHILIVGSNAAAMAKVNLLLESKARITVVDAGARAALDGAGIFRSQEAAVNITVHDRNFNESDLSKKTLVYVSLSDPLAEEHVATWAQIKGVPVNVVDKQHLSDFITPAQISRGPISLAFSSGGKAPVFIRRIRAALEKILPPSLGTLAEAAGDVRSQVTALITNSTQRREYWDRIFDRADDFNGLNKNEMENKLLTLATNNTHTAQGLVQLVGAGPGDPDLLTIKAHRAMQQADVIVYDNLVSREVLTLGRRDAELIFVGKKEGDHGKGQDHIHQVIVSNARRGKRVVRLKGGDPMLFARAGEELGALREAGINTEVIPGITALSGIAASTQIPLTDRDYSSAVTLVTGRLADGNTQHWAGLAGAGRTLAVYMGLNAASDISSGLIEGGLNPHTPVAIIENGTRTDERQLYTNLCDLPTTAEQYKVKSPALILIGDVVRRAAALQEPLPADLAAIA